MNSIQYGAKTKSENKINGSNETRACRHFSGKCMKQQDVSTREKTHISFETMLT